MPRDYSNITPGYPNRGTGTGSDFGPRNLTNPPGASKDHPGIDIPAPTGTTVQAQADGTVVSSYESKTGGNTVIIEYDLPGGGKAYTRDMHLDSRNVKKGDKVTAGQKIGEVGSTGRSSGPHLHHEERLGIPDKNGKYDYSRSKPLDPDKDPFGLSKGTPKSPSDINSPPEGGGKNKIDGIKGETKGASTIPSPVVLDLDGDGIGTIGLESNTHFDHAGDGFAEMTGWADGDDGFLVRDLNSNGTIDSGRELFGSETLLANGSKAANGFEALREIDTNGDGVIDANDTVFSELRVWKDFDADGETSEGEFLTLEEAGVKSINVNYTNSNFVDAQGNAHRQVGSYTTTDGETRTATDVWVKTDATYSVPTDWVDVPEDIAALPDAQGYGKVRDLHQAMAMDATGELKALVTAFTQAATPEDRDALITQIIYRWTGVQDVDPSSRASRMIYGNAIGDARKLEALEEFMGEEWAGVWCWGTRDPNPHGRAAPVLLAASLADRAANDPAWRIAA